MAGPNEEIPHSTVVLTLALHGTVALAAVNPFVSYWTYIALAAMFFATLMLYTSRVGSKPTLLRDVAPIAGLWTVIFLATVPIEVRFGELGSVCFVGGITALTSLFWLVKPQAS